MTGDLDFYQGYYGIESTSADQLARTWNLAPTDKAYVVRRKEGERRLVSMGWGLIPHWAEDSKQIHINARAESVADKPAFRRALALHRCLIPADGFYEWESPEAGRTPHWVFRADGHPMTFAGIWSAWRDPATEEWTRRFSIITTKARGVIEEIHHRMPVVLPDDRWEAWLDEGVDDPNAAASLIDTIDPDLIMEHQVSSQVNSVRNNHAGLREPFASTLF